ncbi:MAG: hypothetical protein CL932_08045 [Deltaproteobacteria bacterium]|nr:hypothetical protein [Deltaproteobacteria bacterium]
MTNPSDGKDFSDIYTAFIHGLQELPGDSLVHRHVKELKSKRGLHIETLKDAGLVSGLKERVAVVVRDLLATFPERDLEDAGITYRGMPSLRWMEDESEPAGKIIIPYWNASKTKVLYIRAHKLGPKGVPLQVYGQHILGRESQTDQIVLTEGEYKALALIQSGIPALAVPGISSFAGKYLHRLKELLGQHRVREVVILFDNEVKNDPSLPSFKADPLKRWDTDYYAIRMAQSLYSPEDNIDSARIARLPDDWRINGKIDPDAALAAGRTPGELQKVVKEATIPIQYKEELPYEGRVVVGYKQAKDGLWRSQLKEENGIYIWSSQNKPPEFLSNFLLLPTRQTRRADGTLERVFVALNKQGEESEITIQPSELVSVQKFKQNLLNTGNYHWSGNQKHLDVLARRLFVLASPKVAKESDCFGRLDDGQWVFGDGIMPSGHRYPLGDDGVVWGQSLSGIIPLQDRLCPIPELTMTDREDRLDLCEAYSVWRDNIGTAAVGLGLGWILGCVFSDDIFAELGFYPILGIFGEAKSGKTQLGRWLTSAWGLPVHSQNPLMLGGSTAKGLERTLSKYASMPVWADEFRNSLREKTIHSLRSIYDRSSGVMAQYSADNRTTGSDIRGCLLLSGEEYPTDPALLSRFVFIPMDRNRRNVSKYADARTIAARLPALVSNIIHRRDELLPSVMQCIHEYAERLRPKANDERLVWVYAVPLGVFTALLTNNPQEGSREAIVLRELLAYVEREFSRLILEGQDDDHLLRFWNILNVLTARYNQNRSLINRQHVGLSQDGGFLLIWFSGAFQEFSLFSRQVTGETPFAERTIRSYLTNATYVPSGRAPRRLGGKGEPSRSCIRVDLTHPDCPQQVHELAEKISQEHWDQPGFMESRVVDEDDHERLHHRTYQYEKIEEPASEPEEDEVASQRGFFHNA